MYVRVTKLDLVALKMRATESDAFGRDNVLCVFLDAVFYPELAIAQWIFEPPLQFHRLVWIGMARKTSWSTQLNHNIFNIVFINSTCLRQNLNLIWTSTGFFFLGGKSMTRRICVCERVPTSHSCFVCHSFLAMHAIYHIIKSGQNIFLRCFQIHDPALFKPRPHVCFASIFAEM